jgi:hypothetical protein
VVALICGALCLGVLGLRRIFPIAAEESTNGVGNEET